MVRSNPLNHESALEVRAASHKKGIICFSNGYSGHFDGKFHAFDFRGILCFLRSSENAAAADLVPPDFTSDNPLSINLH